jgi:hypothetical protein
MPSTPDYRNVDANAVVIGPPAISGVLQSVRMSNGQVLIGRNGYPPVAGSIGSSDGSVDIALGAGSIDLTVDPAIRDKTISSVDGSVDLVTGATSVDLSVDPTLRDKAISSPDGSVVVTTGPSTVTLTVASALRDKAIASADNSVQVTTGASVDLSVARPYNFMFNGDVEIWGAGTSTVPTGWAVSGAGALVSKTTTAANVKFGGAAAVLQRVGTDSILYQNLVTANQPLASWAGQTITFGAWVLASVASRAQLSINDGVGTTQSAFHTGSNTYEFLTVTRALSASATQLLLGLQIVTGNTTAVMDGAIVVRGSTCAGWVPAGWRGRKAVLQFSSGGTGMTANPSYYGGGFAATSDLALPFLATPFKGVARNCYFTSTSGGAGSNTSDILRVVNSGDTVIGNTGNVIWSDLVNEVELAKGTALCIKSTETGGYKHAATLEFEEVP